MATQKERQGWFSFDMLQPLDWLLLAVPLAFAIRYVPAWKNETLLFIITGLAIIPLAGWMGRATEHLGARAGHGIGGLLNATFGNAAELIIALMALSHGLIDVVKASLTGSIIGNILLVLGASILAGGIRFPRQTFNQTAARISATSLSLETIEAKPVFDGDQIRSLEIEEKNRAKEIIEDFMIAANGVTARFLSASGFPSIRRVVRTPKRWARIVEIAAEHKVRLPANPDSKALEEFLIQEKAADPLRFPDLSLTVIKLMGAGEYIAELPKDDAPGHFGLAVKDYAHSTAPNRRYPDLLTQRLLKAAMDGKPIPYNNDELDALAAHCTAAEDAANKVERQVEKSAAALLLESRIGEQFDAIVMGASAKGTWARLLNVPVEGKVVQGFKGLDVGERLRVQLVSINIQTGFIDFRKISSKH